MPSVSTSPAVRLTALDPAVARLVRSSHSLIAGLQTPEGAYPASPAFPAYEGYCWFRDGAFIADAMSAYGDDGSATAFFDWCAQAIVARRDHIHWIVDETRVGRPPSGERMLPARFTYAGEDGADEWWDFQLDGYGTWLWALGQHLGRFEIDASPWLPAVELTVDYLLASWSRPCYDWWEEHSEAVHVSTLACIAAGLQAVADAGLVDPPRAEAIVAAVRDIRNLIETRGVRDGHLVKWLDVAAVDGSLASAIAPLGLVDATSDLAGRTVDIIERHLTVGGGVHRYLGDTFFGGGQWPLLSCFLGLAHAARGDRDRGAELLAWAVATANAQSEIPEQVDHHLIAPGMRQEWVDRWGPVATPLLWSHAMIIRLAVELAADDTDDTHDTHEGSAR
ncbi:glycoside hydrolase family 15 [Diaminobutyricibacter tongyongensis]|uniref:Glycoside hydrolase family 15 n=1 Tax=Leifsonia tongyongensis TaxID=1268043 RepID=A0A6L9Y0Q6_9MICO|nr:glycoside hydrolase family 15 protein [Diaminobutyricibacter tongyongensis]NEN07259.1 glycoside hydrolase family 15 [Diaminobutyricibacter tongyongensis]